MKNFFIISATAAILSVYGISGFNATALKNPDTEEYIEGADTTIIEATAPANVTGLKGTAGEGLTGVLKWDVAEGADGYIVYRKNSSGIWAVAADVGAGTSYSTAKLSYNSVYTYAVKSYINANDKKLLSERYTSVTFRTGLEPVSGFKACDIKNDRATLKWNAVPGSNGYIIYKYDFKADMWKRYRTVSASVRSLTIKGLSPASVNYFSVRGYRKVNGTEILSVTHPNIYCMTKPNNVTGLKAGTVGAKSVKLKWNKTTGASGYIIYKYNEKSKAWKEIKTVSSKKNTYTVKELTSAKKYRFAVKAYKSSKGQKASSAAYAKVSVTTRPEKVKGVKKKRITTKSVTLSWKKTARASGYAVYQYDTSGKKWKCLKKLSADKTSYTVKKLKSAGKYRFAVKSYINVSGKKLYSESLALVYCTTAPGNVTGFKQSDIDAGSVTLKWNKTARATGYIIYRYDDAKKKWVKVRKVKGTSVRLKGYGYDNGSSVKFGIKAYKKGKDTDERKSLKMKTVNTNTLIKLKSQLESMVSDYYGDWSIYVKNLDTNEYISINDSAMYPASTIKLFCMAATYERIKQGRFSEGSVYDLLHSMITVSDNQSFDTLTDINGKDFINQWINTNGFSKSKVVHKLNPSLADYGQNSSSAKDCGKLLEQIYRGKCVSKSASQKMFSLLTQQERRWKIPAGIPDGVLVANKTGEVDDYAHDTAIVCSPKANYIICIFCHAPGQGWTSGSQKHPVISRAVYEYFN